MDGYEVKKVMDQIHISEKMQEDIIMNIQSRMESRQNRTWNVKRMAATAAAFVAVAGMISFPVRAVVASVVQERMESVPREEMTSLNDMVQSQPVAADSFSREFTDKENGRIKELWREYKNGNFPENVIAQANTVEEAPEGTLCYIRAASLFNLPVEEMTDEEMLQIIDFQNKMSYAVSHGPQAQAAAAESREKVERLQKTLEDAGGGISVDEAVEIARKQLKADLGDKADNLELMTYADGAPGVCLLDASDFSEVEFESESKAGVIYEVGFGNPDTHTVYGYFIDAVDGRILYTYE